MPQAVFANTTPIAAPSNRLAHLSIADLVALYDAFVAASDGVLCILNQPRTKDAAVDILDDEMERLDHQRDEVISAVRLRAPRTSDEIDQRAQLLVAWEASFQDWQAVLQVLTEASMQRMRLAVKGGH